MKPPTLFSAFDQSMMQRALALAAIGRYSAKPNPQVGCVLVKEGDVIAEGWHKQAGRPHAEREALNWALAHNVDVAGASAYVTLEPCSHTGRTSPCADALIASGVSRVVVAMQDPNPLVSGQGLHKLIKAGIHVECGLLETQAKQLNTGFIKAMETKLPYVRLKMASSLDGRTAMSNGDSKWITGPESRKKVHFMRAEHGALITGIGTVLADNPSLNVRLTDEELASIHLTQETCHPIRVILDPHLSLPLDAKLLSVPGRTIVMTSKDTVESEPELLESFHAQGIELVAVAAEDSELDIESVLHYLAKIENINDVMVEAGATVAGAFIKSGFVDEVHSFIAPILMGELARPMFAITGVELMDDKLRCSFQSCEMVGNDIYVVAKPALKSS